MELIGAWVKIRTSLTTSLAKLTKAAWAACVATKEVKGTEKELVELFILSTFSPGEILTRGRVDAIEAAQARLFRQIQAASKAGSAKNKKKTRAVRAAIKKRWEGKKE